MKKNLLVLTAILLCLTGCAEWGLTPPFDMTGVYRGTWTGVVQGGSPGERSCAVSFDLQQDNSYKFLEGFALSGTATVYFSCASLLDDIADTNLPARVTLDVKGFLTPGGRVNFASVKVDDPQTITIAVSADGKDADKDGTMDRLDGRWTLIIDQTGNPRITINGSVEAGV